MNPNFVMFCLFTIWTHLGGGTMKIGNFVFECHPTLFTDCSVSMWSHISRTVSTCFVTLRQIHSIRQRVPWQTLLSLVVSLVLLRLDYWNATLAGLPSHVISRQQSTLNASAWLLFTLWKCDHMTPLLQELHWLKMEQRIEYKLTVLVYRCLQGLAPPQLTNSLQPDSDIDTRRLCMQNKWKSRGQIRTTFLA